MTPIEHIKTVMFRSAPLSEEEKQAFLQFSLQLKRQLDSLQEELEKANKSTESLKNLRHLIDSLPGISVF